MQVSPPLCLSTHVRLTLFAAADGLWLNVGARVGSATRVHPGSGRQKTAGTRFICRRVRRIWVFGGRDEKEKGRSSTPGVHAAPFGRTCGGIARDIWKTGIGDWRFYPVSADNRPLIR